MYNPPSMLRLLEGHQIPVNTTTMWRETITMETLRLDLLTRYKLPIGGLGIEGGLTAAHRRFIRVRRTVEYIEPMNARFQNPDGLPAENNGRVLVLYDGTWPESNHFTAGVMAGLSYMFPILDNIAVVPEVIMRKEFTPPKEGSEWPSYFASGGLSIAYTF